MKFHQPPLKIQLQNIAAYKTLPTVKQFKTWLNTTVRYCPTAKSEIVIRVVDESESAALNKLYRHKSGPTNILSFNFEPPADIPSALLGDLVICAPLLVQEAQQQNKTVIQHWAHLVVHGTLHLLGYDHQQKKDATIMEALEIKILTQLRYPNPYSS